METSSKTSTKMLRGLTLEEVIKKFQMEKYVNLCHSKALNKCGFLPLVPSRESKWP